MALNQPKCLVQDVQDDRVLVHCANSHYPTILLTLGGREGRDGLYVYQCGNDLDMASLFQKLRDHGVAFQGGQSGWPPAAIFTRFREKGLLQGPFQEAVFGGHKRGWILREK